jgi:phycocyanobilin:ferredoxin oxidoreductase
MSSRYRRAHIDVVDARETRGLWMMHCCVFPHLDNPAPIFGFDVIAGKNKITGCFIDYSPSSDRDHPMIDYFGEEVGRYEWIKKRELPDWAKRIFSPHMVAAGNVSSEDELNQIASLANIVVNHYLECVDETKGTADTTITAGAQNYYAQNQKQNPHTPKVMASLGLNEDDVKAFIQECLFPEIR